MKFPIFHILIVLVFLFGFAEVLPAQSYPTRDQKGTWYGFWGWNRDVYSRSNIHFRGNEYDFELSHVNAHDIQPPFSLNLFFNPVLMTIPQTNARLGYFFRSNFSLSLGLDHMKYVMQQDQFVEINGNIAGTGTQYDRNYLHETIFTDRKFLTYEHTDGLNYINAELRKHTPLWSFHKLKWLPIDIENFTGIGTGVFLPKTNCRMFDAARHDDFHLSGLGIHMVTGLGLKLWNHLLIQTEFKGGFIDMPDIRTTQFKSDRAAQHFWFGEITVMVGACFGIKGKGGKS